MELNREYAALSAVRFMDGWGDDEVREAIKRLDSHMIAFQPRVRFASKLSDPQ